MNEIFEQIPNASIATEEIKKDISEFIKRVSEIIMQKKSEEIQIELNNKEIEIMTWRFKEKIIEAFNEKWWNIEISSNKKMTWPQWDIYEIEVKTLKLKAITN